MDYKQTNCTLVVGDMHNKEQLVLPRVDAAIEIVQPSQVVFLGDYVDEWASSDADVIAALRSLAWWNKSGTYADVPKTFLLGNHDFYYLLGEQLSGTHMDVRDEVCDMLLKLEPRMALETDGYLLTHAGVTQSWFSHNLARDVSVREAAFWLNEMYDSGDEFVWDMLAWCGPARGGFELPGPLWADRHELIDDPLHFTKQVVGHSPVTTCCNAQDMIPGFKEEIWFCDTLSLMRTGTPVGDGSFLVIEDGQARPLDCPLELAIPSWTTVADTYEGLAANFL